MTNPLSKYLPFADEKTPKPEEGTWVLVSPSGKFWSGPTPLQCVKDEMNSRVPAHVALGRIAKVIEEEDEPRSLLHKPVKHISEVSAGIPGGCYCPPDKCQAPVIMGQQTPCLRRKGEPS
jgi:hypothetical protein